jgi:hypothetical protein
VRAALLAALAIASMGAMPVAPTRLTGELTTDREFPFPTAVDAGWVVFWEDSRHSPDRASTYDGVVSAYGARVSASNAGGDLTGLRASTSSFDQSDPGAGCIGSRCLLVWQRATAGIWSRTFDAVTGALGPEVPISTTPISSSDFSTPRAVGIGGQFLVAWANGTEVAGRLVALDGTPQGSVLSYVGTGAKGNLGLVTDGARAVMTWFDANGVHAAVANATGNVITAPIVLGTAQDRFPQAAMAPNTYLVVWIDGTGTAAFRRLDSSGAAIDASPVYPFPGLTACNDVSAVSDGTDFVFVCGDGNLQIGRVSAASLAVLTPLHTTTLAARGIQVRFGAPLNGNALVTWSQVVNQGPRTIYTGLVNLGVAPLAATSIAPISQQLPDMHMSPKVAQLGSGYAVVFEDMVDGLRTPWARVFDATGAPAGAAAQLDPFDDLYGVDVAFDGPSGVTRAVWAGYSGVAASALGPSGASLGAVQLSATPGYTPHAASLAGRTLVIWGEEPSSFAVRDRFIEADGGLSAATGPIVTRTEGLFAMDVAASATGFAMVWATRLGQWFSLLSSTGELTGTTVSLPVPQTVSSIALASDGTGFLAVWNAQDTTPAGAARLSGAGVLLDTLPLTISNPEATTSGGEITQPDVVWDGTSYVVAWTERVADGGGFGVYVRRVDTDGGVGPITLREGGPNAQHSPSWRRRRRRRSRSRGSTRTRAART